MKKNDFTILNRKARYEYFIEDTYRAGLVLKGSEVKAIRESKINISDAFCFFNEKQELFLKNAHITSCNNLMFSHEETSDRKLLLSKKELNKLFKSLQIKGYTIVPLSIIVPSNGYIKIDIALCKGKHEYDKRETIKERDIERELKNGR